MLERRNTESLKKIFAGYDYIMTAAQLAERGGKIRCKRTINQLQNL